MEEGGEMIPNHNLEMAANKAIVRATPGPVKFSELEEIANGNGVRLQRLLSYLDLAAGCDIDYYRQEVKKR